MSGLNFFIIIADSIPDVEPVKRKKPKSKKRLNPIQEEEEDDNTEDLESHESFDAIPVSQKSGELPNGTIVFAVPSSTSRSTSKGKKKAR